MSTMGEDLLPPIPAGERWTAPQWQAVVHRASATLVSAAAGSGKTSVLVRRIVGLVSDAQEPADVDDLLVVTFTKAAAAEMRQRLGDRLAADSARNSAADRGLERQLALLGRAQISTLHAFCLALLRQNFYQLDLDPGFVELGEHEARLLQREVLEEVFERRYGEGEGDRQAAFLDLVDRCAGDGGDQGLDGLVLDLHDTTRSLLDPDAWLDQAARRFDLGLEIRLEDLPICPILLGSARRKLDGALRSLEFAENLALGPAGPSAYAATIADERRQLAAVCAATSLEPLRRALQGVDFRTLPRIKAGDGDPDVLARVKRLRDGAKKVVSAYRDPASLDSWLGNAEREAAALAELRATAGAMRALVELVQEFEGAYQQAKKERTAIDFADQERLALALLREKNATGAWSPSDLAWALRSRLVEVLVDEYQDINQVQDAIIRLACREAPDGEPSNLFMVGDPKQSIYRFRHADPALFRSRYQTYASAGPGPRRIDLSMNFRSRAEIVAAANFLFRQILTAEVGQMAYDAAAELVCGATYPPSRGEIPVEVHVVAPADEKEAVGAATTGSGGPGGSGSDSSEDGDDRQVAAARQREARLVARRIRELTGLDGQDPAEVVDSGTGKPRPVRFRDVVILLRAANSDGQVFVDELAAAAVPAHVQGKSGYFGALEIQTMLALLEVLDNPRQDIPLAAVLRSPLCDGRGLRAVDLARIRLGRDGDFFAALQAFALAGSAEPRDDAELRSSVAAFLDRLEDWRTRARRGSLGKLVWGIYQETGFLAHAAGLPNGEQRRANLLALHDRAREFDRFERQGLSRFLRFIERLRAAGEDLGMAPALSEAADVVRVMSIHASKGLEFPVVFACGLGKRFNEQDLRGDLLFDPELGLGPKVVDVERRLKYPSLSYLAVRERLRQESLAEEIRLLYVALTRAKERLILVGSVRERGPVMERWAQAASCRGWGLPADLLGGAHSLLDLVGLALARHLEGAAIRKSGGFGLAIDPEIVSAPAPIVLRIVSEALFDSPLASSGVTDSAGRVSGATSSEEDGPDPAAVPVALVSRLSWRYSHQGAASLPAKISVTEAAKRLKEQAARDGVPLEEWQARSLEASRDRPDLRRQPRFLQLSAAALTPAERGTAAHLFMQHLDFTGDCDRGALERQLAWMTAAELLTPEMARAVPIEAIATFMGHPLADRLRLGAGRALWRELPFSMLMPAREVGAIAWPARAAGAAAGSVSHRDGEDESVLLQGVIDAVLAEGDGLVVVDWKTDAPKGRTVDQMAEPHLAQIALYRRAAAAMFGRPVKAGYLVFLQTGEVFEWLG